MRAYLKTAVLALVIAQPLWVAAQTATDVPATKTAGRARTGRPWGSTSTRRAA